MVIAAMRLLVDNGMVPIQGGRSRMWVVDMAEVAKVFVEYLDEVTNILTEEEMNEMVNYWAQRGGGLPRARGVGKMKPPGEIVLEALDIVRRNLGRWAQAAAEDSLLDGRTDVPGLQRRVEGLEKKWGVGKRWTYGGKAGGAGKEERGKAGSRSEERWIGGEWRSWKTTEVDRARGQGREGMGVAQRVRRASVSFGHKTKRERKPLAEKMAQSVMWVKQQSETMLSLRVRPVVAKAKRSELFSKVPELQRLDAQGKEREAGDRRWIEKWESYVEEVRGRMEPPTAKEEEEEWGKYQKALNMWNKERRTFLNNNPIVGQLATGVQSIDEVLEARRKRTVEAEEGAPPAKRQRGYGNKGGMPGSSWEHEVKGKKV
jgi:hypothetical protein